MYNSVSDVVVFEDPSHRELNAVEQFPVIYLVAHVVVNGVSTQYISHGLRGCHSNRIFHFENFYHGSLAWYFVDSLMSEDEQSHIILQKLRQGTLAKIRLHPVVTVNKHEIIALGFT